MLLGSHVRRDSLLRDTYVAMHTLLKFKFKLALYSSRFVISLFCNNTIYAEIIVTQETNFPLNNFHPYNMPSFKADSEVLHLFSNMQLLKYYLQLYEWLMQRYLSVLWP